VTEGIETMQTHQTTCHLKKHPWTEPLYVPSAGRLWRSVWMAALVGTVAGLLINDRAVDAQTVSNPVSSVTESLPASTLKKLHPQIVLALKQRRGEPPFDKPTSLHPDIPMRDGDRVLVDLDATTSDGLLNQIALIGGKVASSPDPTHIIRAMIPLTQVEALAGRTDVNFISPAIVTVKNVIIAEPQPQPDGSKKGR
jgi:hypothetical protein